MPAEGELRTELVEDGVGVVGAVVVHNN